MARVERSTPVYMWITSGTKQHGQCRQFDRLTVAQTREVSCILQYKPHLIVVIDVIKFSMQKMSAILYVTAVLEIRSKWWIDRCPSINI